MVTGKKEILVARAFCVIGNNVTLVKRENVLKNETIKNRKNSHILLNYTFTKEYKI